MKLDYSQNSNYNDDFDNKKNCILKYLTYKCVRDVFYPLKRAYNIGIYAFFAFYQATFTELVRSLPFCAQISS